MPALLAGDVVVISPHLDDAVLSLGATMARGVRVGARIRVLTVFAGIPASATPAGGWDARGGWATEGDAARGRREEDRAACAIVGAEPVWLDFPEADYARKRQPDAVVEAVTQTVGDAGAMLVPGFPLTNPDHAWIAELLLGNRPSRVRVGLYAEQPYRYMVRGERRRLDVPAQLRGHVETPGDWIRSAPRLSDLRLKKRAIEAYESQLPLLGLTARRGRKLRRMLLDEALRGGEAIAWVRP